MYSNDVNKIDNFVTTFHSIPTQDNKVVDNFEGRSSKKGVYDKCLTAKTLQICQR